jgi:hypothetical protein
MILIRCIVRVEHVSLVGQLVAVIILTVFVTKAYIGEKTIKYQLVVMFTLIPVISLTNSYLAARFITTGNDNTAGGK